VIHDGMPYDPSQGQGHETFKVSLQMLFQLHSPGGGGVRSRPLVLRRVDLIISIWGSDVRTSVRPQKVFPIPMKFGM